MHDVALFTTIRQRTGELLDPRYFPEALAVDELVVEPGLGDAAGVAGAILLAAQRRPGHLRSRSVANLAGQVQAGLPKV